MDGSRMDARLTFLYPTAGCASLLTLILTGCSTPPTSQAPQVHPALALFNEALTLPAMDHSIVREGDRITYMVELKQNPAIVRFDASCTRGPGRMSYPTRTSFRPFANLDGTGSDLPAPQAQQLQHSAQLQNVCKARPAPDWRALTAAVDQDWLLLDRNSLEQNGGLLYVWAAHRYQHYQIIKNSLLVAQNQERLALDCTKQTIIRLSQFNLDDARQVANGSVQVQLDPTPLKQASADHQEVFKAACQSPAALGRLPEAKPRQPLAPVISTPVANPAVLAAIRALELPVPPSVLGRLDYEYEAVLFNGTRIGDQTKQTLISTDAASAQTLVQTEDSALGFSLDLTFRGLFELASHKIDRKTAEKKTESRALVALSFQGDWRNLPLDSHVSYTRTWSKSVKPDASPSLETSEPRTVTCRVVREQPASSLNPALHGSARMLECITMKMPKQDWTFKSWYLADYGVFAQVQENTMLGVWNWDLKSAQ